MALELQYQVPVFSVRNLEEMIEFFEKLGYTNEWKYGDPVYYAGLYAGEKGENVIHLSLKDLDNPAALYLQIADVDEYYAHCMQQGLTTLEPPKDQDYGMRDFVIIGPEQFRVTIGTELTPVSELLPHP